MNTNIANELEIAKDKAQYDESAKRLLSNVWILAWILSSVVQEFEDVTIGQVVNQCIGNDIQISRVRVRPGETNDEEEANRPERIIGENTEDKVPGEGIIFYDVRFSAYTPGNGESVKILLNVEAQRGFYVGYPHVTRGVFYAARMISAQLDTEFTTDDYSGLKKVYSIWICMNAPDYIGNAIAEYGIRKKDIIEGIPDKQEAYDKMSVVMICLNRYMQDMDDKNLTGMLNTVFAEDIPVREKKRILSEDYGIAVNRDMEKEMDNMCNLSEGIWERGIEKGIERGRLLMRIEQIRSKFAKGKGKEIIAEALEESMDFVQKVMDIITENPKLTDMEIVEKCL